MSTAFGDVVRTIGNPKKTYVYKDVRLDRRGFLDVYSFEVEGESHRFDVMDRGDASAALPVDFENRLVYMIAQPRHAKAFGEDTPGRMLLANAKLAAARGAKPPRRSLRTPAERVVTLEVVAGGIENGEKPVDAAIRELEEEAGIKATPESLSFVREYYTTVGCSTEKITGFIARVDDTMWVESAGDGHETITVHRLPWEQAWRLVDEGRICTCSSLILLSELRLMDRRSIR